MGGELTPRARAAAARRSARPSRAAEDDVHPTPERRRDRPNTVPTRCSRTARSPRDTIGTDARRPVADRLSGPLRPDLRRVGRRARCPGETALLTAGVLAGAGRLSLPLVIAVAIAAAVTGDTLGYWLGRRGGRAVLATRRGPFAGFRALALERGERFFDRHGAKTVFLGRFVPGVRVVAAVLAGAGAMPWPRFAVYNLSGAFVWAATVASLASLVGPAGRRRAVDRRARRRRRSAASWRCCARGADPAAAAGTYRGSADAAARSSPAPRRGRPPPSPRAERAPADRARARRARCSSASACACPT